MWCGSTVCGKLSIAAFGAAEMGAAAGKNEADGVEFTCAARENPKSKTVNRLMLYISAVIRMGMRGYF